MDGAAQMSSNEAGPTGGPTFSELIERYERHLISQQASTGAKQHMRQALTRFHRYLNDNGVTDIAVDRAASQRVRPDGRRK